MLMKMRLFNTTYKVSPKLDEGLARNMMKVSPEG